MATHYDTLGVDRTASSADIARAYLRKTSGSRTAGFLRGSTQSKADRTGLEEAFAVLSDLAARRQYDETLDQA